MGLLMIKVRTLLLLGGATLALASCNTVEGIGRDLSSAGDAVADAAR